MVNQKIIKKAKRVKIKIGDEFERLSPIAKAGRDKQGNWNWWCECICGEIIIVRGGHLRSGHTRSCGCLVKDTAKKTHIKHGMYGTSTYNTWRMMIQRCQNSITTGFERYGGRGITVCKRWLQFECFLEDMGERPENLSIERKNNDLGYYKENCYWATRTEQSRNKRVQKRNSTGVTGVRWNKKLQKYFSSIGLKRKRISLGYFIDINDAIKARKAGKIKYWGELEVQHGS